MVDGLVCVDGKPWIPRRTKKLLARLLVVAHSGSQGHRGEHTMLNAMSRFALDDSTGIIKRFVRSCLLSSLRTHLEDQQTQRSATLDYLALTPSYGVYAILPTAAVAAKATVDWLKRFDAPETSQSDNGTHFRTSVLDQLSSRLKYKQLFPPPYSPWINGTVERVNRDLLQMLRLLLMEYQLDSKEWPYLLLVVQVNLNHTQLSSLGDKASVELFTSLPASSALDAFWDRHHGQGGDLAD
ncbi:hypothetical protein PHMEG_00035531, partial [Phytophthora megakarya]